MAQSRSAALIRLIQDVENFEFDLGQYNADLEPQSMVDNYLTGKLEALAHYCQSFGWSDLSGMLEQRVPVRCSAQAVLSLVQDYVLPEIHHRIDHEEIDSAPTPTDWFWRLVHPRITALAKPRFDAGFFGDAVEASLKEVNDIMKRLFLECDGRELDGAPLMYAALSPNKPVVILADLATESGRNMQQGYMQIFAGAMIGIRNPKAHENLNPDSRKCLHLIALASLLMCKLDERV